MRNSTPIIIALLILTGVGRATGSEMTIPQITEATTPLTVTIDSITSTPIYFPLGQATLDISYMDNAKSIRELNELLTYVTTSPSFLDSVRVVAISSPEGGAVLNKKLALRRALALSDYITTHYPAINPSRIYTTWATAEWKSLRNALVTDAALPNREQVLSIINKSGTSSSAIEGQLRKLGTTWNYLQKNYLDKLRYDQLQVFYRVLAPKSIETKPIETKPVARDTVTVVRETIVYRFIPQPEPIRKPVLALKTNLLFDLATALNVELEVPIGQRWSIAGEYLFPWWLWRHNQYCFQTLSATIEGRIWLGDRTQRPQLNGWFVGLYIGGGYYDLEWNKKGYQGEFIVPGISAGYAHKIGRNLSLEYALGLGVVRTKYREYKAIKEANDWCLHRIGNDTKTWIGPTKAKVSLVWMINSNKNSSINSNTNNAIR